MLRTSAPDFDVVRQLYDRLDELPAPWFAASRTKLPCIAFKLLGLSPDRTRSGRRVYRADTPIFGMVEIKTRQDPSRLNSVYLVHLWTDTLMTLQSHSHQAQRTKRYPTKTSTTIRGRFMNVDRHHPLLVWILSPWTERRERCGSWCVFESHLVYCCSR